jgi:hypothetical protein
VVRTYAPITKDTYYMEISHDTLSMLADSGDAEARVARQYYNLLQISPRVRGARLVIKATTKGYAVDVPSMGRHASFNR